MTPRRLVAAVILAFSALRLAMACGLSVGNDEAYYAQLAAHPDWSYFDHPPMLAIVANLGMRLGGQGSAVSLRVGFVALFALSTWVMFRFASRLYGQKAGAIAAIVLNATAYYGLAVGTLALPDGPLLFFSLLTIDRLLVAIDGPRKLAPWGLVGLAWGGAMLSKYSAVFLAVGAFGFLVTDREHRIWLMKPGPYLAFAIGLMVFSPVIVWNAAHGWISFAFQGERALGASLRPMSLLGSIAGQVAYLFPWIWAFLMMALVRAFRRREVTDRFLLWQALPPLAAFLMVALRRDVLPHWSLIGLLPAFPLLGREWAELRSTPRRLAIFSAVPVVLAVVLVSQSRWGWLPVANDPTADGEGWDQVLNEVRRQGLLDAPDSFLFTSTWYDSGHLAFASGGRLPVLCYAPRGGHNFDLWNEPQESLGKTGVLVVAGPSSTEPAMYDRWFERIEPAGSVTIQKGNRSLKQVRLYRCVRQVRPFDAVAARPERVITAGSSSKPGLVR